MAKLEANDVHHVKDLPHMRTLPAWSTLLAPTTKALVNAAMDRSHNPQSPLTAAFPWSNPHGRSAIDASPPVHAYALGRLWRGSIPSTPRDARTCAVTLLFSQHKHGECTPLQTFGCIDGNTMWTSSGCRGIFNCSALTLKCGYLRTEGCEVCSCLDGRTLPSPALYVETPHGATCALSPSAAPLSAHSDQNTRAYGAVRDVCYLGKAGLTDRIYIYERLGDHVLEKNATLWIPSRPCDSFDWARHNHNHPMNCVTPWSAYFDLPRHIRPHMRGVTCTHLTNAEVYQWSMRVRSPRVTHIRLSCNEYQKMRLPSSYTLLQIRRGDVIAPSVMGLSPWRRAVMDENLKTTSVDFVATAHVSLFKLLNGSSVTLYTTNERDHAYLARLHRRLRATDQRTMFVDEELTPYCKRGLQHVDNFCVFCAVLRLKQNATAYRKFGRH